MFIGGLVLASLFITIFFYIFPFKFGRGIFLISLFLITASTIIWRVIFPFFFKATVPLRKILIVGLNKEAQIIHALINENPELKVIGFIDDNPKKKNYSNFKILGNSLSLEKIANEYKVNDIVLSVEPLRNKELGKVLINCRMKGKNIYNFLTFHEYFLHKLPVSKIKERWFLYCNGFEKLGSDIYKRTKRAMDFLISLLMLIVGLPVFILTSLLIKITSEGSIFLFQERVGENKKLFKMYKFRTMVENAEVGDPQWARENDKRVTKIGKILRKTRLDELPQLINVIKGDMSLIGPRPEREFFVKKLMEKIPYYSLRFSVKPGLTGWAQINYKYGASEQDALEKLQYELYYAKNMSLSLDLAILLKTVRIVLFGMGK